MTKSLVAGDSVRTDPFANGIGSAPEVSLGLLPPYRFDRMTLAVADDCDSKRIELMTTAQRKDDEHLLDDPAALRADWLNRLNALTQQVQACVEKADWKTRVVSVRMRDSTLGRFEAPLLLMERNGVQVALNPVSRFVPGSDGAVDLYVVPAYDEVASLYLEGDTWF